MTNTMRIWDAVSKTNPDHTKRVNQRGGFTAVDAHSQIMAATKQFGPVGEGWGYTAANPIFTPENLVIIPVTLWHGARENVFGPEFGCAELVNSKGRRDADAPKKAETDAITKLLSRLGFNADVFLGLYDDSKYIEQMQQEFAGPEPTITDEQQVFLTNLAKGAGKPLSEVCGWVKVESIKQIPADKFERIKGALDKFINEQKENENA